MRVIKRERKGVEYFYLQHAVRENGNVRTIEHYLGREIPKDIEHRKAALLAEARTAVYHQFETIRQNFQKEWKRYPKSAQERELQEIAIAFTYNTNAIEGSTITLAETREILEGEIAPRKSLKDIRETEAHATVFLKMLKEKEKITSALLLRWHAMIFGETKTDLAGKFRDYGVRVGAYRAPDWQEVKQLMSDLGGFILKNNTMHIVELAGRAHYRFEKIHPFGDGNGRIGRLLMNHLLWYSGYPMLIIEKKKRKAYYHALGKDEEGFVQYFLKTYLAAHRKQTK